MATELTQLIIELKKNALHQAAMSGFFGTSAQSTLLSMSRGSVPDEVKVSLSTSEKARVDEFLHDFDGNTEYEAALAQEVSRAQRAERELEAARDVIQALVTYMQKSSETSASVTREDLAVAYAVGFSKTGPFDKHEYALGWLLEQFNITFK